MKSVVFSNADKDDIYEPHDTRNLANHQRSSRILISGPPSTGKSNIIKNLIVNQCPEFDRIIIFHLSADTREYDGLNAEIITDVDELPVLESIDKTLKHLIIYEDVDFSSMKEKDRKVLDGYLRYGATHKGISVYVACQNFYTVPVGMRRKIDIYYITRSDTVTMNMMCRCFSIEKNKFKYLIDSYLNEPYSNLCFDNSGHPVKIRHNIFKAVL